MGVAVTLAVLVLLVVVAMSLLLLPERLERTRALQPPGPELRRSLAEHQRFVGDLRELVWQHRDLAPELSTIVLDEIRTFQRRQAELDGPDGPPRP